MNFRCILHFWGVKIEIIFFVLLAILFLTGCKSEEVISERVSEITDESLEDNSDAKGGVDMVSNEDKKIRLPSLYPAPDIVGLTNWINSAPVQSLTELRGKVVLVDFWTYSCINCIRTLPHIQALHEKYGNEGLVILGIHAPEFSYEKKISNVRAAVDKYGLTYPIVQDNDFQTWRNYKNRYWPAHYLIDKEGNVRATHFGEGAYEETDRNVALLLEE